MRYCPQGEGNWCSTAHVLIRRRILVLFCFREKVDGAVLCYGERKLCCSSLLVNSDESRQFWKTFGLLHTAENDRFYLDKT